MFTHRSKERPIDAPSLFPSASGKLPTSNRPTKRALTSTRSVLQDELGDFQKQDQIAIDSISSTLSNNQNVVTYQLGEHLIIQSTQIEHGIPRYMIKLQTDLTYKTYHLGVETSIRTLRQNNIRKCKSWSA